MASPETAPPSSEAGSTNPSSSKKVQVTTQRLPLLRLSDSLGDMGQDLPERYRVREEDQRVTCLEAPTLSLEMKRGLSFTASAAKSKEGGSIFLDGTARMEPFLDPEAGIINLDHHEGCIRAFTLSTCEQAFILVSKGLDLQGRDWTIYANEPDLDTLLAIWVLFNHRRIRRARPRLLDLLIPMIRLEGAIDVHGFELRHFAGLSSDVENRAFSQLEHIRREEAELKQNNEWTSVNLIDFSIERLHAIDRLLYEIEDFEGVAQIEELARAELPEQKLAIACRSEVGIYAVEEQLRSVYDQRLALIVLQKDDNTYTLRQSNAFSRSELDPIYDRLNLMDSAAGNRNSPERWGGSSDIGGSPRSKGTRLSVHQIIEACRAAGHKVTFGQGLARFFLALMAALSGILVAALPFMTLAGVPLAGQTLSQDAAERLARAQGFSAGLLLLASLVLATVTWHGLGTLGWRRPAGTRWLAAAPVALGLGFLGGAWVLDPASTAVTPAAWIALIGITIGCEFLFRGVVFGAELSLWAGHRRRWYSSPRNLSAFIYALCTTLPLMHFHQVWALNEPVRSLLIFLVSFAFGQTLGWAREESESLLPPMLIHAATVAILIWRAVG